MISGILTHLTLTISQAAGLAASIYNPRFWAKKDAAAIAANGSQDTLLKTFHQQRAIWRLAVAVAVATLASAPAAILGGLRLAAWLFVAQITFNLFYFVAEFNTQLSQKRGKDAYYVSWNPSGSKFDAFLWRRAWRAGGHAMPPINGPHPATQERAGEALRSLTLFSKWLGYAFYLLFAVTGYCLSYGF